VDDFNPVGIAAVYASDSIALAVLEVLVHLDRSELPSDYVVIAIGFLMDAKSAAPLFERRAN